MKQRWTALLPAAVIRRLEDNENFPSILVNTIWLFGDKILRMGIGLFVGVWVARYLGPQLFGTYNFALAFVALFSACAALGIDNIVIRDLVQNPENSPEVLGSAFGLKLVGATVTYILSAGAIFLLRPGEWLVQSLVLIVAIGFIFQAVDVIDFWFQSQVSSRFTVVARNMAFLVVSSIKVILIVTHAPLVAFAWAGLAETALGAIGLLVAYRRSGHDLRAWRCKFERALQLLGESWPLFLSAVFVMIYIKIDQVMVGQMLDDKAVGIYSAAVSMVEVWYFIPMAITASVFPAVINARKKGPNSYYGLLERLYLIMIWLSLAVAVPITLCAGPVMSYIFGSEYQSGAGVLSISCWSGLFIFFGLVSNHWYLLEDLNRYTLYRHILGAICNILLNLVLIPRYGITGAAVATLATQFITSYLFDCLNKPTKKLFYLKSKYYFLFVPLTIRMYAKWKRSNQL